MTRRFQGLGQTAATSEQEVPDGVYLVRVEKAQYRWHAQKPFYFLRLAVLEPRELAGRLISGGSTAQPKLLYINCLQLNYNVPWNGITRCQVRGPVYHLYMIRTSNREGLKMSLAEARIGTATHCPVRLHRQKAYASLGYEQGDFPVTERVASEILSLPMYPGLRRDEQALVTQEVVRVTRDIEHRRMPSFSDHAVLTPLKQIG